eukprot:scaffold38515_cov191-Amphora_coffeaeformis.AAC.4
MCTLSKPLFDLNGAVSFRPRLQPSCLLGASPQSNTHDHCVAHFKARDNGSCPILPSIPQTMVVIDPATLPVNKASLTPEMDSYLQHFKQYSLECIDNAYRYVSEVRGRKRRRMNASFSDSHDFTLPLLLQSTTYDRTIRQIGNINYGDCRRRPFLARLAISYIARLFPRK